MVCLGIIVFLSFFISDKLLVYTQTHVFNNELSTKYYIKADLKDNIDKITSGNKDEINKRYDMVEVLLKEFILKGDLQNLLFENLVQCGSQAICSLQRTLVGILKNV